MTDLPTWLAVALAVAGLLFPVGGVVLGQFLQRRTTAAERRSARLEAHADEAIETVSQALHWLVDVHPTRIAESTPDEYVADLRHRLYSLGPSMMKSSALLLRQGRAGSKMVGLRMTLHELMAACGNLHLAAQIGHDTDELVNTAQGLHDQAQDTVMEVLETIHDQLQAERPKPW